MPLPRASKYPLANIKRSSFKRFYLKERDKPLLRMLFVIE